jgi:hypothetical protein
VTGHYFHHQRSDHYNREADDVALQEKLLKSCEDITGVRFPNKITIKEEKYDKK